MKGPSQVTTGAEQAAALFAIFDLVPESELEHFDTYLSLTLTSKEPKRLDHDQEKTLKTFHSFQTLPCELRCMVWEYTWPLPRLICMSLYEDERTHQYTDLAAVDAGCFDDSQPSICHVPVALQVCQESRRHTLKRYRAIEHVANRNARFYVDPGRDLLWSDSILIDELQNFLDLGHCYRRQLAQIEMLFVEEDEWRVYHESGSMLKHFVPFRGLKMIVILLEDDGEVFHEETDAANDRNDGDGGSEQSKDDGVIENAEEDLSIQSRCGPYTRLHGRANELRAEYAKLLSGREVPKHIYCVDKTGKFY